MTDLYRCTPRQLRGYITDALYAGLVPFVQSSPGVGKSSINKLVAHDLNLQVIDHRLSTSAPEDLSGLPQFDDNGFARFAPLAELFPLRGMAVPKGKEGWMLFLDEFNSAAKSVQAAAYKLILDRMVGQHHLHENCVIAAAGNLATDRAIVNNLSTAMQSRVVHLELEVNYEEWQADVAFANNYDNRIIAFLAKYPSKLMDFRPDHNEKTFCCPRTWEFVNKLLQLPNYQGDLMDKAPMLTGAITSGVATEFITFCKVFKDLVKIGQVIRDPLGTPVPTDNSTKWATIAHLMEKVDESNFDQLTTYANRFDLSFRILFFRSVMTRAQQLRHHPAFMRAMGELSRYLNS